MKSSAEDYSLTYDFIRRDRFTRQEWEAADPLEPVGEVLYVECRLFDPFGQLLAKAVGKNPKEAICALAIETDWRGYQRAWEWMAKIVDELFTEEDHAPTAP